MAGSLLGQSIGGKYTIVEQLGRGGMAEVYKAYQENLDRHVAIKVMHAFLADEADFLNRFRREARAMASLNHPNIVRVYDFDVQEGTYYIVMELLSGGSLKEKLELLALENTRLPLSDTLRHIIEIADALAYAHHRGMVHRDIKPGNIMIGDEGRAVLTDFGIAKIVSGPTFTATGAMIGTPAYMSPEQGLGQTGDERSDLYALGVLFFQMAAGRLPYDGDTPLAVIMKHVNAPVPRPAQFNAELPDAVQDVILKTLAKEPSERYQSARDLARDLRAAVRAGNIDLAASVPSELLRDRPTPPPVATLPGASLGAAEATRVAAGPTAAAIADKTHLAEPPILAPSEVVPPALAPRRRISLWVIAGVFAAVLILAGAATAATIALRGRGAERLPAAGIAAATATEAAGLLAATTPPTSEATSEAVVADRPPVEPTIAPSPTATTSPTPVATSTPTSTPTPDVTTTFLAGCVTEVTLVNSYTYQNQASHSAPVGVQFPINWVLRNSGTCPLPAGLLWTYRGGEEFSVSGPVTTESELKPGEELILTASLIAPASAATYESRWQLLDGDGNTKGAELEFEVVIYLPATPMPTATPSPTAGPTATATTEVQALGYNQNVSGCEYVGTEWRCQLIISPYGGTGPYTLWVFDADQPAEYRGQGPFTHFAVSRRCFPWIHNIRLQDDGTGQSISADLYISPDDYFPGGCTQPP